MFIQHLRSRKIEILLRDMYSPLPQRIHARFRTHTFQLSTTTSIHLFRDLRKINPAG